MESRKIYLIADDPELLRYSRLMKEQLEAFFLKLEKLNSEQLMEMVAEQLSDESIETFVDHIEEFYGIEDDEQLGMLAQIMVTGFLAAKSIEQH